MTRFPSCKTSWRFERNNFPVNEVVSPTTRSKPETISAQVYPISQRGISAMWTIIEAIYLDYCQARLEEIQKLELQARRVGP